MDNRFYYVYILSNWNNRVLYVGVTGNIVRRMYEHKNKKREGFTAKYNINKLVFYEYGREIKDMIAREKQIKGWSRKKKIALIEGMNPDWVDLADRWEEDSSTRPARSE